LLEASRKVANAPRRPVLVGFAAETEEVLTHAQEKLVAKGLDFIVANDISAPGAGFQVDTNRVTLLGRERPSRELAGTKRELAGEIWNALLSTESRSAEN
jgi:phosphopantothenoylcysteine decarboxylase/phosphopantothenate--cysteine ligase